MLNAFRTRLAEPRGSRADELPARGRAKSQLSYPVQTAINSSTAFALGIETSEIFRLRREGQAPRACTNAAVRSRVYIPQCMVDRFMFMHGERSWGFRPGVSVYKMLGGTRMGKQYDWGGLH